MGTRPLAHAGRRSAGLGGDGRARPVAHAVGVRAREADLIPHGNLRVSRVSARNPVLVGYSLFHPFAIFSV